MAITKKEEISKIEVVHTCIIQVKLNVTYEENGKITDQIIRRYSLSPCGHTGDGVSNWVWHDTDISNEPKEVQDICKTVWTSKVKEDYKQKIIAQG